MDQLNKIVKSSVIVFFGIVLSKLFGYIFRVIIARIGTEEYGMYNLGITALNIAFIIGSAGMLTGITRFVAEYIGKNQPKKIKQVVITALVVCVPLSIFLSGILFFWSGWIAELFHNTSLVPVFKIISIIIPIAVTTGIFLSVTDAFKKMHLRVLASDILENGAKVILIAILIWLGYGLFGALIAFAIATLLSCIMSALFMIRLIPLAGKFKFDMGLLRYSVPLLFAKFLSTIYGWIDTIMIGILLSTAAVGIYNSALPTAMLLLVVPTCILSIYLPTITEIHAKKQDISAIYRAVTKWIFFLNLPIMVFIIMFAPHILVALFGETYRVAGATLAILTFGFFVHTIFRPCSIILHLFKKSKLLLLLTILWVAINAVLNFFFISRWGIVGAAISTAATMICMSVGFWISAQRLLPMKFLDKSYLKAMGVVLLPILITKIVLEIIGYGFLSLFIGSIFAMGAYLLLLIFSKSLNSTDIEILRKIKQKLGIRIQGLGKFFE